MNGIPDFLKINQQERKEAWKNIPMTSTSSVSKNKDVQEETEEFRKLYEEQKLRQIKERKSKKQIQKETPNLKTHRWDSIHSCWVPIRIYDPEANVRPNFHTLDNKGLVQAYNEMAVEAAGLEIPATATKRFSTRDAGLRRCEDLYKSIVEKKGTEYEQPEQPIPTNSGQDRPAAKKVKAKPKPALKSKKLQPKTPKEKKPKEPKSELAEACGIRNGSLHLKIVEFLHKRLGEQVSEKSIIHHLYGDDRKTNRIVDLMKVMSTNHFKVTQQKDEKGNVSYGLYKSGR